MNYYQLPLGPLGTNCYIVSNAKKECLIIDPGEESQKIIQYVNTKQLKPLAVLLTHAHFDHIGALDEVRKAYSIPAYVHKKEANWLADASLNGSSHFLMGQSIVQQPAEKIITDEGKLSIGDFNFAIFETPGHSPGSVSYYAKEDGYLFSGDVLFKGSIGRTDLPGGSMDVLMQSIHKKILVLPEDTIILSGHGPVTLLQDEMDANPFLNGF
ncbi:MBL fold metallo-hydrolase [Bacillus testis]|uniref:MBL fold metallo-hydrolase n=1 Tax=Bacillus testis TaxID=1622072 RepID=UPI00067EAE0A|nr:MBL fold metallo-hydrolase [Bacillus testis]